MQSSNDVCRLCGGVAKPVFHHLVLGKYDVGYARCERCASLQTEPPTWLDEAYDSSLASTDVGAVQRCLFARAAVRLTLALLGGKGLRLLDFGGGTGLLCRLLRDGGIDAWTYDRYGQGDFAQTFRVREDGLKPGCFDVVSAFEVMEHFPDPARDLARLVALKPRLLITTTQLYRDDCGADWWYLAPDEGQHVFFYSRQGLTQWADQHGYDLISCGVWQIFAARPTSRWRRLALRAALSGKMLRLMRVLLELAPSDRAIAADHRSSRALAADHPRTLNGPATP